MYPQKVEYVANTMLPMAELKIDMLTARLKGMLVDSFKAKKMSRIGTPNDFRRRVQVLRDVWDGWDERSAREYCTSKRSTTR